MPPPSRPNKRPHTSNSKSPPRTRPLPSNALGQIKNGVSTPSSNPFAAVPNKKLKHEVLNRRVKGSLRNGADSKERINNSRSDNANGNGSGGSGGVQSLLEQYKSRNKVNRFEDKRFGENNGEADDMTVDEKMMERFKRERVSRSKKESLYNLDDDSTFVKGRGGNKSKASNSSDASSLTHKGQTIDAKTYVPTREDLADLDHSDDDEIFKSLDKADTSMHFGGGNLQRKAADQNPYGMGGGAGDKNFNLGDRYMTRKEELDDVIKMSKVRKMERQKTKEEQVESFGLIDDSFKELRGLLEFRDKEKERSEEMERRALKRIAEKEGRLGEDVPHIKGGVSLSSKSKSPSANTAAVAAVAVAGRTAAEKTASKKGAEAGEYDSDDEWDREMRSYLFEKKGAAKDRTKTDEELAKEEAEKLVELEEKRLKRMNGEFDSDDELSDIEIEGGVSRTKKNRGKKAKAAADERDKKSGKKDKNRVKGPDELDTDSEEEEEEKKGKKPEMRFTADGIKYFDKRTGKEVPAPKGGEKKSSASAMDEDDEDDDDEEEDEEEGSGSEEEEGSDEEGSDNDDEDDDEDEDEDDAGMEEGSDESGADEIDYSNAPALKKGLAVKVNYRAEEQFQGKENWFEGAIVKVYHDEDTGDWVYDVAYNDGDTEDGVPRKNIKPLNDASASGGESTKKADLKKKKILAKEQARKAMPFTFEAPPTTLDALHDLVGLHCANGKDAITLIDRIHKSNSVRLNAKNINPMQNFYDVLMRRFSSLGDALFESGDGAEDEVDRRHQLSALVQTLYKMSADHAETAGAVFARRVGVIHRALQKRISDAQLFIKDDGSEMDVDAHGDFTAWPSMGTVMLLRSVGHIFPVTDLSHPVVTPVFLILGQCLGQCGVRKPWDLASGLLVSSVMLDFCNEAKRVAPEAIAFISGALRLFSGGVNGYELPTLSSARRSVYLTELINDVKAMKKEHCSPTFTIEKSLSEEEVSGGVFTLALSLAAGVVETYDKCDYAPETLAGLNSAVKALKKSNANAKQPFIAHFTSQIDDLAAKLAKYDGVKRVPMQMRKKATVIESAIVSLAPKLEEEDGYKMTKDKSKEKEKATLDKLGRQFKREKKAAGRELRLDSQFIETKRREEKNMNTSKGKEERNKNHAWLEGEQATINQQVRLGGGLMKGGGSGTGKAIAKKGIMGVKRGQKQK